MTSAVPSIVLQWAQRYDAGLVSEIEPRPWWKPEWRAWMLHDGSALLYQVHYHDDRGGTPWIMQSPVLWGGEGIQ